MCAVRVVARLFGVDQQTFLLVTHMQEYCESAIPSLIRIKYDARYS